MKTLAPVLCGLMFFFIAGMPLCAQSPVPPPSPAAGAVFGTAQLEQLVGPIALYPDPLIAEILPAATFPGQIVMANRYVSQGGDPGQIPDQGWDPSVQALAHYPNVLKWMDDNLAWTTQLGQAFQSQEADVMNVIQQLRAQAQNLGNLSSTPQESVVADDSGIEIEPTDPDQMYVPSYQPDLIYYQPGYYCTFPFWLPMGIWLVHDFNWREHGLIYWGPGHPRPKDWWHVSSAQRHSLIVAHPPSVWHAGAGASAARGGWERGYEAPRSARFAAPAAPHEPAPAVTVIHSAPTTVRSVPAFSGNHASSASSKGFFVGGQSGHEAVESSSRGQASRAEMGGGSAPRESGGGGGHGSGGGGGGGSHGGGGGGSGGGGGGGGGGGHAGGGGHR